MKKHNSKRDTQWGQFQFEESEMMDIDESGYNLQKKKKKESKPSNITDFIEPNPIYDFSIIDRKIEEINAILEELYKLKEYFEQVAPKERGFCSYLA
jgi:hypothetical protein